MADSAEGLRRFCELYLEWSEGEVGLVKPQSAYFERFGSAGISVLEGMIARYRDRGVLVILDAKRGDIGPTSAAYADAYFNRRSPLLVDALTVHPYLGFASLVPIIDAAAASGGAVFVVAASSNPEGVRLQNARYSADETVIEHLAASVSLYNASHPDRPCGAVVGATRNDVTDEVLARFGDALLLSPGVGAQGATIAELAARRNARRLVPTSSRGIARAGPSRGPFVQALRAATRESAMLWRNAAGVGVEGG